MPPRKRLSPPRKLASYDPHDHQITFHQDTHKYRALVSGVGAGKTRMGVEEVIKWTQLYPGSLGVIGRLTAKSLRETTQRRFFEVCPPELIENYNKAEEKVWLKTNAVESDGTPVYSEILFMHFDDPGPLGSLDISYFWIDEAHEPDGAEVPEATFQMLTARLRHPVGPHRGFITSNSGGKDWVWKWFFNEKTMPKECIGWRVPTSANAKYLPPNYEEELRRNNPETWVARFLDASFDAFEGQIFTEFDEKRHTFNPLEVDVSPAWDHGVGFDFGVTAPTAAEYGAVDRDGIIWIYDEDYEPDADVDKFAARIKGKGFEIVYADPSVVNRGPNKKSPKDLYSDHGVNLLPASNDTDYFVKLLIQLFREDKIRISTKCVKLIDQIKMAAWDPKVIQGSVHDKMKVMENHALDALKYFLNTFGLSPGLLNPVSPKGKKETSLEINGEWEHESYLDDADLDSEDYPHEIVKRRAM